MSRSRVGRPYRRLRRWTRHTTNQEIALTMMGFGAVLVLFALIAWALL